MDKLTILNVFYLAGGLSIFLYGMQQGEKNLQRFGTTKIRKLIAAITRNRFVALLVGFSVTVLTQSSSATTVMLVGLASANLLSLYQSLGIILGSNIGTTLTVQLFAFKFHHIAPLLIAVGFGMTIKDPNTRVYRYGRLVLAFGFVFFGMKMMSESVAPLRSLPAVREFISLSLENPFLGLAVATVFTAIVQSSAATLAILIVLAQSHIASGGPAPDVGAYLPLVLGANMGTCATAFLATLRAKSEGIRVAWAHFLFKAIGTLIFIPLLGPIAILFSHATLGVAMSVAVLHTLYNLVLIVIFLPFLAPFARMVERLVPEKQQVQDEYTLHFIRDHQLALSALALTQAAKEISRIFTTLETMLEKSRQILARFDPDKKQATVDLDDKIDFIHEAIVKYLARLGQGELDSEAASQSYELIMITTDLEHIGDIISKSLCDFAEKMDSSRLPFPDNDKQHIIDFYEKSEQRLALLSRAFQNGDTTRVREIYDSKHSIRGEFQAYCDKHIEGLYQKDSISMQTTSIYIDVLEEIQRVNSFTFRLAGHLLQIHRIE